MLFSDIKKEICRRVGDNNSMKYRDVAGGYFIGAISDTIISGQGYALSEIHTLVNSVILIGNRKINLVSDVSPNLFKILSVTINVDNVAVKEITKEEFERGATNDSFLPDSTEIFWYRDGNYLYIITGDARVPRFDIEINYIDMPSMWGNDDDITLGIGFIYRMISRASADMIGKSKISNEVERPKEDK